MTPEQSLVVLEMACYDDQFLDEAYHFSNHTDVDGVGLVLIANKTRWVETFNYPCLILKLKVWSKES